MGAIERIGIFVAIVIVVVGVKTFLQKILKWTRRLEITLVRFR